LQQSLDGRSVRRIVVHDMDDAGQMFLQGRRAAVLAFFFVQRLFARPVASRIALGCQLLISDYQGKLNSRRVAAPDCKCLANAWSEE
jgi:hypothetical protein